jgi:hypothetical protein
MFAGVDVASTYCYAVIAEQHRGVDTWSLHRPVPLDKAGRLTIPECGAGFAYWAQGRLERHTVQCDAFHTEPVRRARQHAVAPRRVSELKPGLLS